MVPVHRVIQRSLLLILLAACGIGGPAGGEPWPRFRGPNGEGAVESASIPEHWTVADCNWRVELPGSGYSSPVVWGDRVVVTSALPDDGTQVIRALRTADGGTLWETRFPAVSYSKHAFNSFASSTPALDGQHVFYTWTTPEHQFVAALALDTGRELWRRDLGPYVSQHGSGASLMLCEGMVIVPHETDAESFVAALDVSTGAIRWKCPRRTEKTAFSTPFLYTAEGSPPQLILASWAHGLYSLDPRTGKPNWEWAQFQNRVVGSPVPAAGRILVSNGEGGIGRQFFVLLPGSPGGTTQPRLAYEVKESLPYVTCVVARGDLVFLWFDKGVVTCLDGPTGAVHWRERIGGDYFGSPVRVGSRLYCISRAGELVVLAAEAKFQDIARIDLGEPSHSTPAVADGAMYLRTTSHVLAIGGQP